MRRLCIFVIAPCTIAWAGLSGSGFSSTGYPKCFGNDAGKLARASPRGGSAMEVSGSLFDAMSTESSLLGSQIAAEDTRKPPWVVSGSHCLTLMVLRTRRHKSSLSATFFFCCRCHCNLRYV